jgi:single-strand DNA-binding protein
MTNIKNTVQLIGNLGNNPEVKTLDNGNKMARFSVAINDTYTNKAGEKVTDTQWHNITVFGSLAGVAEKYLTKGKEVAVQGKLVNKAYDDKDGNKKYSTEILVSELLLLGSK